MKRRIGAFCETYGNSIRNRVLECLLESQDLDWAVGDIAKHTGISRPKAYEIIEQLEKQGFVNKSRIVGRTQLFFLNKENPRVKLLLKNFRECLMIVAVENQQHATSLENQSTAATAKS